MSKKKQAYSMTARERKELRRAEEEKINKKFKRKENEPTPVQAPEIGSAENTTEAAVSLSKKQLWIPITCAVLALVIILTAVLLLLIKPERTSIYPRAHITLELNDGSKTYTRNLTLTIWEDESPIAATNFIFLAKIKFFDGNIIYDVQESKHYMRFGAYTDYSSSSTKYNDSGFVNSIPRKIFNVVEEDSGFRYDSTNKDKQASNKFGYRLKTDSNGKARIGEKYAVSFNSNDTADFVINMGENNTAFYDSTGKTSIGSMMSAFGSFEDEDSREVLDWLMSDACEKRGNTGLGDGVIGFVNKVKIKEIKIENLDDDKWDDLEFISYMKTILDGNSGFRAWYAA